MNVGVEIGDIQYNIFDDFEQKLKTDQNFYLAMVFIFDTEKIFESFKQDFKFIKVTSKDQEKEKLYEKYIDSISLKGYYGKSDWTTLKKIVPNFDEQIEETVLNFLESTDFIGHVYISEKDRQSEDYIDFNFDIQSLVNFFIKKGII